MTVQFLNKLTSICVAKTTIFCVVITENSMVFGEIVEPSTRALIIDEDEEYVDHPHDYS